MSGKLSVIVDPHFRRMNEIFSDSDLRRLHDTAEIVWGKDQPMPAEDFESALRAAKAVVCADWRYGDVLDKAKHLRAILTVSGGFPLNLDYSQCFARSIRVLSAAPAFARQVAEMTLGMTLAASREIVVGDMALRANNELWQHEGNKDAFLLFGKRVGFIGYGSIARALRPLIEPFGCPMVVYDPWLGPGYLRSQKLQPVSLEELLDTSWVIFVLAVPSTENRTLLSRSLLERIQPGAVLVLMSRAHVIDFEAMTDLVLAGRFKAAIDVFPDEPFDPNHPIRNAPGAVLSAHRAGSVNEGLWEIGEMVVDDLEAIVRGFPPQRLQLAEPELFARYASNKVSGYLEE